MESVDGNSMDAEREKYLLELWKDSEREFEKLIIYIASGGLALSISISEKIITISKVGCSVKLLFASWICFALTILLGLTFHFTSIKAIDLFLQKKKEKSKFWNKLTNILRILSVILLFLGVSMLVIYAIKKLI